MRSLFTPLFTTLTLCLATALPAAAVAVAPSDPTGSLFDVFFDVVFDADLTNTNQDNTHAGFGLQFAPGSLFTDDLLYDSAGGTEGVDGFSLILDEIFTPNGAGGGVMSFLIDNRNNLGQPMFPGVGADIDETILDISFSGYGDTIRGVSYLVDGTPGSDALPATIFGEAPIELELGWFNSPELAGAQSIQVDVAIGAAAVPEPTSLVLVGSLGAALLGLRRRRTAA